MNAENVRKAAEGSLANVHAELVTPEAHNAYLDSLQAQLPVEELDLEPFRAQLLELDQVEEQEHQEEPEEKPKARPKRSRTRSKANK